MKKILQWLKKRLHCLNNGHDYYYQEYIGGGTFICKNCGHVSNTAFWSKEDRYEP